MKKFFTLVAGLLMLSASAETLTVFDGAYGYTSTDAPIYGYMYDTEGYSTQTIYPEAELTAMQGKAINSMKFYVAGTGNLMNGGELAISVGTTTTTSFPNWEPQPITGLTHVADITMTEGETEILVTFDEPFVYDGGNLVFEAKVTTSSGYAETPFYGVESDINNVLHKGNWTASVAQFYPKTTFDYGEGGEQPEEIRGDVDGNGEVGIADVTALIDMLLAGTEAPAQADANLDDEVGISDVTAIIDYLLSGTWPE